jgi:hypothetical protein
VSRQLEKIQYDVLTPEEIQALTAYDQLCLLTELGQEVGRLTGVLAEALDARFEAKSLCIDDPTDENRKLYERAQRDVLKLQHWIRARNVQKSGLQSNLKATR